MVIVEAAVGPRLATAAPGQHRPAMDPSGTPAQAALPARAARRRPRSIAGDLGGRA
jgi:hypothetical protein